MFNMEQKVIREPQERAANSFPITMRVKESTGAKIKKTEIGKERIEEKRTKLNV